MPAQARSMFRKKARLQCNCLRRRFPRRGVPSDPAALQIMNWPSIQSSVTVYSKQKRDSSAAIDCERSKVARANFAEILVAFGGAASSSAARPAPAHARPPMDGMRCAHFLQSFWCGSSLPYATRRSVAACLHAYLCCIASEGACRATACAGKGRRAARSGCDGSRVACTRATFHTRRSRSSFLCYILKQKSKSIYIRTDLMERYTSNGRKDSSACSFVA